MTLAQKMKAVLDHLNQLPASRERALAITKLEECALWSGCTIEGIGSPVEWLSGDAKAKRPAS